MGNYSLVVDAPHPCHKHGEVRKMETFLLYLSVNILGGLALRLIDRMAKGKKKGPNLPE